MEDGLRKVREGERDSRHIELAYSLLYTDPTMSITRLNYGPQLPQRSVACEGPSPNSARPHIIHPQSSVRWEASMGLGGMEGVRHVCSIQYSAKR